MKGHKILGIIMAGGKGERLYPLVKERTKPAVPFGGKYRIIDFVLNNFINSGIHSLYVLVQYKAQSLIEHIRDSWPMRGFLSEHFIIPVPPQMRFGEDWYKGTADAVYQNLNLILDHQPDLVAVFGADHIYRMDIGQMVEFHLEKKADVTVAAIPVPIEEASSFGIIEVDEDHRILGFEEKPRYPKPIPQQLFLAYSSMGNYLFNTDILIKALKEDAQQVSEHDFGKNIIPGLFPKSKVFAYNFLTNEVPGFKDYEEKGYWRDVGSIQAYWLAHMDLLGTTPSFNLNNPKWPIRTSGSEGPSTKILKAEVEDSIIAGGCTIIESKVKCSILGRGVVLEEGSLVENSILMDFTKVGKGAKLKKVIVDRFNIIENEDKIGYNSEIDKKRFFLDLSGIVVIPKAEPRATI